ncbi:MAG: GntR family transcriptional regulator, partial [Ktedonobacterales bacterium]
MKRMTLDLLITLDRSGAAAEGLTRQIYAQLRQAILSGRLRAGDRLPPSRALAQELDVARLTVATAYDWLRAEGYVAGRVGAGTFVAPVFEGYAPVEHDQHDEHDEDEPPANAPASEPQPAAEQALRPALTVWARRIQAIPLIGAGSVDGGVSGGAFDFRPSVGAADLFPWARWRRIVAWQDTADPLAELRAQARESAARAGRWDALLGPPETRAAIAAWLRRSRSVRCDPDQLLIASSVQQVLALLARLLVEP